VNRIVTAPGSADESHVGTAACRAKGDVWFGGPWRARGGVGEVPETVTVDARCLRVILWASVDPSGAPPLPF